MGNWDQMDPNTLAPEQEQQLQRTMLGSHPEQQPQQQPQQQQTMLADQAQEQQQAAMPLQPQQAASTTPGWANDKIIVKEEPADDKHNDSGISPGPYTTSSGSPQSQPSTTSTGSISPQSIVSNDSNDVQMNGYHNGQRISPPMMDFQSALDYAHARLGPQPAIQIPQPGSNLPVVNVEEVTSMEALGFDLPEDLQLTNDALSCPLCSYTTRKRIAFSEHIQSHCPVASQLCRPFEFNRALVKQLLTSANNNNLDRVAPHLEDSDLTGVIEHEFRTSKLTPQNKVKVFRCKQCGFAAMTKVDYWMHHRQHIKPEKLLTCPNCPFVTEYKHHLEYHLRNHFKSKPYKCPKCPYACVNKSMLNSHLKSHSSIYQFRCAECSYATKYCHSLKLHLRKYNHRPAMVLNTDGSPNPLPIIDVYGTRRGPKAKPNKDQQGEPQPSTSTAGTAPVMPMEKQQTSPLAAAIPQFHFNPLTGFQPGAGFNAQGLPAAPALMGFPYNPAMFTSFQMANAFTANAAAAAAALAGNNDLVDANVNYMEMAHNMIAEGQYNNLPEAYLSVNAQLARDPAADNSESAADAPISIKQEQELDASAETSDPLDLSKTDDNVACDLSRSSNQTPPAPAPQVAAAAASAVAPATSPQGGRTSRRKGRAFKVDRNYVGYNNQADVEMPQEAQRASPTERLEVQPPSISPVSSSGDSRESRASNNEFSCEFCDISFGNEVMHSVHMGYHGFQNPFTCNMCGLPCTDKVTFFLHIARVKH